MLQNRTARSRCASRTLRAVAVAPARRDERARRTAHALDARAAAPAQGHGPARCFSPRPGRARSHGVADVFAAAFG